MTIELDTGIVGYIMLYAFLYFRYWKHKSLSEIFWISLFYIYLCALIDVTILPIPLNYARVKANFMIREGRSLWDSINLIPNFSTDNLFSRNMVLNVMMTMPFGFFMNKLFIHKKRLITTLKYGIVLTLSIETIQLMMILLLGSFKIVDVDDVFANTLGAFLGFIVYSLVKTLSYDLKGYRNKKEQRS